MPKGRPSLDYHPAVFDAEGNRLVDSDGKPVMLSEWPEDADNYKSLPRDCFSDETVWLEKQAEKYEQKAAEFRSEIEIWRKYDGNPAKRKQAEKASRMASKLSELLAGLGDDVDKEDLLGTLLEGVE